MIMCQRLEVFVIEYHRRGNMKKAIFAILTVIMCFGLFSHTAFCLPEGAVARLGKGVATSVTFSPDGKILAVASFLGVHLYEANTFTEVAFIETNAWIISISFSPDGKLLAGGGYDGMVRWWDVASREEIAARMHSGFVMSVCFSPDGKLLASASLFDGTVILWDVASRRNIATFTNEGSVYSISFSPDGKILACAGMSESEDESFGNVRLFDVVSRKEISLFLGQYSLVLDFFYSVDFVCFSPDGRLLAGASGGVIKLWDVLGYKETATLEPSSWANCISFSPDGKFLASGCNDGTVKLWDVAGLKEITTLVGHSGNVNSVCFNPDSKILASASSGEIKLWDASGYKEITTLLEYSGSIYSTSFSLDGRLLASGGGDQIVKLWDVVEHKQIARLDGHSSLVQSVSFSPDGKLLASGSYDKTVKLWNVSGRKEIATLAGHSECVTSVCFSPDGKLLASGSWDKTVKLWDVLTRKEIATLEHSSAVTSVCFSPDGKLLASGSWDKTVKLWDVSTRKEIATLSGHSDWVNSISFSPDGKLLASGSDDKIVILWDVASRRSITLLWNLESVRSVCFSPDGKLLASGDDKGMVKLWNVTDGKEIATLVEDPDPVYSVSFSPDGKLLACGSEDGTILLWDMSPYITGIGKTPVASSRLRYIRQIPDSFKSFENDLSFGMSKEDVKYLQVMLVEEGPDVYPENYLTCAVKGRGRIDGNFMEWTRQAVVNFQEKYKNEILTPAGLTSGTGIVGANTRKKLNELLSKYREEIKANNKDRVDAIYDTVKRFKDGTLDVKEKKLPSTFPIELVLAISSQETGLLYNFNNELIGEDNAGRGIMQITTTGFIGSGSGLTDALVTKCQNYDSQACYSYYSNTVQGVEANIKDGIYALGEKYSLCKNCTGNKNLGISDEEMHLISTAQRYHIYRANPKEDTYIQAIVKKLREFNDETKKGKLFPLTNDEKKNASYFADVFQKAWDNSQYVNLCSPGELQIYDSSGQITGLVNSNVTEVIPNSIYDMENKTAVIFFPSDTYRYEVIGTSEGTYGLDITSTKEGKTTTFNATDIPTSPGTVYQYTVDWNALSKGEKGVTVKVDSKGDGTFETTITADATLTGDDVKATCVKGDVNGDGSIKSNDAILALRISAGLMTPTSEQQCSADMNEDGNVKANDAILILRKVAGLGAPGKEPVKSETVKIMLNTVHGKAGDSITVPVTVDNADMLSGGDVCIAYDSKVLRAVDVSSDPDVLLVGNVNESGTVRLAFAMSSKLNNRKLADIKFDVLTDDVSTLTFKTLELYDLNALPINSKNIDGRFLLLIPKVSALMQNYPNPFNPETWIPYQLKEDSDVEINIYNEAGQLVRAINLGHKPAGMYTNRSTSAYWDGKNEAGEQVSSGVYFYSIKAGNYTATKKMLILR
jgi:WD40 repeat protein